ncbi:MAG TPA: recombination mediator RecR [Chitinophagales bacterium]|nr:recombination mediator RecR [Chitinophagales bacterium]
MNFPSKLIEQAVAEFEQLPGIGKKTALRLVLYLMKQDVANVEQFTKAIEKMRNEIRFCKICHNISDHDICSICSNPKRNTSLVCVVETIRDVIAIESTNQYFGLYHVLGGVISPMEGIGPDELKIESLVQRSEKENVKEVIMALNPTIEGDTTIFYISKKLQHLPVKITSIARGVSFGGELEYVDDVTLARSIVTRMPYENYLVKNSEENG